jgi:hypothetical protein
VLKIHMLAGTLSSPFVGVTITLASQRHSHFGVTASQLLWRNGVTATLKLSKFSARQWRGVGSSVLRATSLTSVVRPAPFCTVFFRVATS